VDLHGLNICHSPIWDNISIPFILVGRLLTLLQNDERSATGLSAEKRIISDATSGTTTARNARGWHRICSYQNQKAWRN
jgi:hypothetical protein